jgi:hypothetical protein
VRSRNCHRDSLDFFVPEKKVTARPDFLACLSHHNFKPSTSSPVPYK